mgnify:CR=1 FL=1
MHYRVATSKDQLLYLFYIYISIMWGSIIIVKFKPMLIWMCIFFGWVNCTNWPMFFVHQKLFVFAATLSAKIGGARKLIFEQKEWKSGPIACLDWANFYSNPVIFIQIYQIIASQCSRQKKEKEWHNNSAKQRWKLKKIKQINIKCLRP